jgi:hypothetical protein
MKIDARITAVVTAALVGLLAGCGTQRAAVAPVTEPAQMSPAPAGPVEGRVTMVNPDQKFVVIDFGQFPVPAIGLEVNVFRSDRNVGRVRLTEPSRGRLITADILVGELKVGDLVRP